jgi:hypothetical protein
MVGMMLPGMASRFNTHKAIHVVLPNTANHPLRHSNGNATCDRALDAGLR